MQKGNVSKKELRKLKPGTWIEVCWNDAPNEVLLFLEWANYDKITNRGDVSLHAWCPASGRLTKHPVHTQIVRILERIEPPLIRSAQTWQK